MIPFFRMLSVYIAICAGIAGGASTEMFFTGGAYASNALNTLHYFVPRGGFQGTASVSPTFSEGNVTTREGLPSSTQSYTGASADLQLGYGFGDRLGFHMDESYLIGQNGTYTSARGTVVNNGSRGFSDPTLRLAYRAYEDTRRGLFGDISISCSPSVSDHLIPSATQDGNDAKGYTNWTLNFGGVYVFNEHEFGAAASLYYYGPFEGFDDNSLYSYHADAYYTGAVQLRYRWHLTESLYLSSVVNVYPAYTRSVNYPNREPILSQMEKYPVRVLPQVSVGYSFSPTVLLTGTVSRWAWTDNYTQVGAETYDYASDYSKLYGTVLLTATF